MRKPKFHLGNPIFQVGETYDIKGVGYTVVTATTHIVGEGEDGIDMTEPLYWLDNENTGERIYLGRKDLRTQFSEDQFLH